MVFVGVAIASLMMAFRYDANAGAQQYFQLLTSPYHQCGCCIPWKSIYYGPCVISFPRHGCY